MKLLLPPVGRLEVEEILRSGGGRSSGVAVSMQARPCVAVKHRLSVLRRIGAGHAAAARPSARLAGPTALAPFSVTVRSQITTSVASWRYVMIES
jgi:hypothetical protein